MRFGLIIYGELADQSGGYLYDGRLVAHLREHGHEVEVISLPEGDYLRHLADNRSAALFERLANLDVDILLQDELNHPSLYALNKRLRAAVDYPIIAIVHHLRTSETHSFLWRPLYRYVERRYLNSVDGFIFNSETTRTVVAAFLDTEKPRVVAPPAGDRLPVQISASEIEARAREAGPLRVAFVGALTRRKAPQVLLEAVAMLPPDDVQATFVGSLEAEPDYLAVLRRLIRTLELQDRVKLTGHLENQPLSDILRYSQVLALPSYYEGFGIVYLEGMSYGLPAIGTRAGAAGEVISHGENGYLIEPGNARELASYLAELHGDRERLAAMGQAAQRHFAELPTWEENMGKARQFLEHYNHPVV